MSQLIPNCLTIVTVLPRRLKNTAVHDQYLQQNKSFQSYFRLDLFIHASVEVSRWGDSHGLLIPFSPASLLIHLDSHLLRSIVNAGIGNYWLSGQLCMDAPVLFVWFQSFVSTFLSGVRFFSGERDTELKVFHPACHGSSGFPGVSDR